MSKPYTALEKSKMIIDYINLLKVPAGTESEEMKLALAKLNSNEIMQLSKFVNLATGSKAITPNPSKYRTLWTKSNDLKNEAEALRKELKTAWQVNEHSVCTAGPYSGIDFLEAVFVWSGEIDLQDAKTIFENEDCPDPIIVQPIHELICGNLDGVSALWYAWDEDSQFILFTVASNKDGETVWEK